jgi:hypothetical protein
MTDDVVYDAANPFARNDALYAAMPSAKFDDQVVAIPMRYGDDGLTAACPYIAVPHRFRWVYPAALVGWAAANASLGVFSLIWVSVSGADVRVECHLASQWIDTAAIVMVVCACITVFVTALHVTTLHPAVMMRTTTVLNRDNVAEHWVETLSTSLNFWHLIFVALDILFIVCWFGCAFVLPAARTHEQTLNVVFSPSRPLALPPSLLIPLAFFLPPSLAPSQPLRGRQTAVVFSLSRRGRMMAACFLLAVRRFTCSGERSL